MRTSAIVDIKALPLSPSPRPKRHTHPSPANSSLSSLSFTDSRCPLFLTFSINMHSKQMLATLDATHSRATIAHLPPRSCIDQPIAAILNLPPTNPARHKTYGSIFLLDADERFHIAPSTHHHHHAWVLQSERPKRGTKHTAVATVATGGAWRVVMGARTFRMQRRKSGDVVITAQVGQRSEEVGRVKYEERGCWSLEFENCVPECLQAFSFWLLLLLWERQRA